MDCHAAVYSEDRLLQRFICLLQVRQPQLYTTCIYISPAWGSIVQKVPSQLGVVLPSGPVWFGDFRFANVVLLTPHHVRCVSASASYVYASGSHVTHPPNLTHQAVLQPPSLTPGYLCCLAPTLIIIMLGPTSALPSGCGREHTREIPLFFATKSNMGPWSDVDHKSTPFALVKDQPCAHTIVTGKTQLVDAGRLKLLDAGRLGPPRF
mmetsp:Transcript_14706/g.44417  ORF Transcript_14706/g.44417 Transcript_14706/m.44417 type:complete len:208 (+) Transcript_14706:1078-1701(+)